MELPKKLISGDVELRRFRKTDAVRLAALANNQKISRNLRNGFPHPYGLKDAEVFINKCLEQKITTIFAIVFKGEYVGNIGLMPAEDVYRKSAEIGYFIGEAYWNKGITTKAVNLITDYGFSVLELLRIHTGIFEYNTASMRVLEKCGYRKEGVFQKAIIKNGQVCDEHRYAKINPKFEDSKTPFDYPKQKTEL